MNIKQGNRFNMIESVIAYLSLYTSLVAEAAGFAEALDKVKELADAVRIKDNEKNGATIGKAGKKESAGKELTKQVSKISAALYLWAKKNNNAEVKAIANISKSDFRRKRDEEKVNSASALFNQANGKDLAFAKVSPADIAQLKTLADEFKSSIAGLSSGASKKAAAGQTVEDMIEEAVKTIKDELDKYMLQFAEEEPEFYNGYKAARVIWDKGGSRKAEEPEVQMQEK